MLARLQAYPLLKGVRGEASPNRENLIEVLERLSFLATEIPDMAEPDINPLIASDEGCLAADARLLW